MQPRTSMHSPLPIRSAVVECVTDDFVNEHTSALGSGCVGKAEYASRVPGFMAVDARPSV